MYGLLEAAWKARQQLLHLGGTDPADPPASGLPPDRGTAAGFPRHLDGAAVTVESTPEAPPPD